MRWCKLSIVINTKNIVLKSGKTKTYQYVYVIFGENAKECYNCGRVENADSYEKAYKKLKELYEEKYYEKLEKAKSKILEYKGQFVAKNH